MTDLLKSSKLAYEYKISKANISVAEASYPPYSSRKRSYISIACRFPKLSILSSSSFQILPGVFSRNPRTSVAAITLGKKGGLAKSDTK
jgi:hypothetical protein